MLVVLTETYCNKVNRQMTQWDDFIQIATFKFVVKPCYDDALTVFAWGPFKKAHIL